MLFRSEDESLSTALLEWNGTNETMNPGSWYLNKTGLGDGNYTYRVWGNDSSDNWGVSETRTVTIEATPPSTSDDAPAGWQTSSFTVNLTCVDATSGCSVTAYRLDGGAWTNGTSVSITTDMNHTIQYNSTDVADNVETTKTTYAALDTTVPQITNPIPAPSGYTTNRTVEIKASLADATSGIKNGTLTLDGSLKSTVGAGNSSISHIPSSNLTLGQHNVTVLVYDIAGNPQTLNWSFEVINGTAPPTFNPSNGTALNTTTVKVVMTFAENVTVLAASLNGQDEMANLTTTDNITINLSKTGLSDGFYTVSITAVGISNVSVTSNSTFIVDTVAPSTSDDSPAGWQTTPFTVNLTCTDATSGCTATAYRVDGGAWTAGTSVAITTNGNHTVEYNSTDAAGNVEATKSTYAALDATAPSTSDDSPAGWQTTPFTVNLTCTDATSGCSVTAYRLDGGAWTVGNSVAITTDMNHTIQYNSTDVAGNVEATKTTYAALDTVAPSTSDDSPAGWQTTPFTVNLTCVDATSGCAVTAYRVDGGAWTAGTSVAITTEGNHTIQYNSTDVAGNVEIAKTTYAALDSVAPSTSDDAPAGWQTTPFTVNLTCVDATSGCNVTAYKVDSGTWTNGNSTSISTKGNHTIQYNSTDAAGNVETTKTTYAALDTTAPSVTNISVNPSTPEKDNLINITTNVSDQTTAVDSVQMNMTYPDGTSAMLSTSLDSGLYAYVGFNVSQFGVYNVQVIANDTAGNINNSEQISFSVIQSSANATNITNGTSGVVLNISGHLEVNITANQTGNVSVGVAGTVSPTAGVFGVGMINSSSSSVASGIKYFNITNTTGLENVTKISIKVFYSDSEISGLEESSLSILYWNGTEWLRLSDYIGSTIPNGPTVFAAGIDTTNNFVYADVDHFSFYGLGGNLFTPPTPPPSGSSGGGGGSSVPAGENVLLVANSIDSVLATDFLTYLSENNVDATIVNASEFTDAMKVNNRLIIILGGPDAPEGIGEIVSGLLTEEEASKVRGAGSELFTVKYDTYTYRYTAKQKVIILAGSDRAATQVSAMNDREEAKAKILS